jgi:hypothetical protein
MTVSQKPHGPFLAWSLVVFGCLAAAACNNSPPQGAPPDADKSQPRKVFDEPKGPSQEEMKKRPVDYTGTAEGLFAEFKKDKEAALKKYRGKTVEVEGVVGMTLGLDEGIICLEADKADVFGFRCFVADKEPWAIVTPGQKLKVKGIWPEAADAPAIRLCVITEAGPNPVVVISAEQLAKDYLADPDGARKKYSDKYMILNGVIAKKEANDLGAVTLTLKCADKVHIECNFAAYNGPATATKEGQEVKLFSRCFISELKKGDIGFDSCQIITK